jgi:hypothetical protein
LIGSQAAVSASSVWLISQSRFSAELMHYETGRAGFQLN